MIKANTANEVFDNFRETMNYIKLNGVKTYNTLTLQEYLKSDGLAILNKFITDLEIWNDKKKNQKR